jgi:diaminopimelate epimerase
MIKFTKMHTLGNDFVIFNHEQHPNCDAEWIRQVANRKTGIGCDQVLTYAKHPNQEEAFDYRIYNADGSAVGQCGNGALCLSTYLFKHVLPEATALRLVTKTRTVLAQRHEKQCRVDLGEPVFTPPNIPMIGETPDTTTVVGTRTMELHALSMGNPHAVIACQNVAEEDCVAIGGWLNQQPLFPQGVNVELLEKISAHEFNLRVYERGAGETMACGSGACAAAVVACKHFAATSPVRLNLPGGTLTVDCQPKHTWLSGPTTTVFAGTYQDPP